MANVEQEVEKIAAAKYGREVRSSICSAILAMNEESEEAYDAAIEAQDSASKSASDAKGYYDDTKELVDGAVDGINEAKTNALDAVDDKKTEVLSDIDDKKSETLVDMGSTVDVAEGFASTASEYAASTSEYAHSASNYVQSASEYAHSASDYNSMASSEYTALKKEHSMASSEFTSTKAEVASMASTASVAKSETAKLYDSTSNLHSMTSSEYSEVGNIHTSMQSELSQASSEREAAQDAKSEAVEAAEGAEYYYEEAKKILSITYRYKGSVQTRKDLPSDPSNGDVYNIIDESGQNVAWSSDENKWDELGSTIDLSDYAKTVDVVAKNQGVASKDKILGIDSNGNVIPIDNYALPTASTSTKGGVKVDGVSVKVDSEVLSSNANIITCSTALNTVAKTASLSNFVLKAGVRVFVTFTDTTTTAPTSGDITLNINNTGAKNIYYILTNSGKTKCTYSHAKYFYNNQTHEFVYDGTNWLMFNGIDANTKNSTGTSEKAATKLYLAGGTSQNSSGVTTYSNAKVYIGTNNELYSNGQRVAHDYATETKTLSKSAWSGSVAPYTYDLGYDSTVDIEIMLPSTATAAQVEAVVAAQIAGNGSDNIIRAWGEKPNVDIPIIVRKVVK